MRWCQKKLKRHILKSTKKNDGVAYHHHSTGHKTDFENVDIITQEKSYWRRLIQEGLEIKQLGNENRANLQAGYEINECWDPILKKKYERHVQEFRVKIVLYSLKLKIQSLKLKLQSTSWKE